MGASFADFTWEVIAAWLRVGYVSAMPRGDAQVQFGERLRAWRRNLGVSQTAVALSAGISSRHLSFIETGRAQPSRAMVLRLAARLGMPATEQDALLLAAGYAPRTPRLQPRVADAGEAELVLDAARRVLDNHEPFPAVALNRDRDVVLANRAASALFQGVTPSLRRPPINIYRILLHPDGLARKIVDFPEYSSHLLSRLQRDAELSGSVKLQTIFDEASVYPRVRPLQVKTANYAEAVLLRLREGDEELSFISALTTFGTPLDLVTTELVVEALFPANEATAHSMRRRAASEGESSSSQPEPSTVPE